MSDQTINDARKAEQVSSLASGVALTFAARMLILGGSVLASIVVGRWLGPEGLGALTVLNVTVALALQFGSAGLPSATTYFIARNRDAVGSAWVNSVLFAFTAGAIMAAVVVLLSRFKPDLFGGVAPRLLTIVAISIPFQLLTLLGLNALLAMDRIGPMNLLDALSSALLLGNAIAILAIAGGNLETLVTFNTVVAALVAALTFWAVVRALPGSRGTRPDLNLLRRMLEYGLKFYVSIVAYFIIFRADLLIVNRFRGAQEAGVYAVAAQLSLLLTMLPGVIAALLFPRVASQQHRAAEYTAEVTRHTSFLMIAISLVAAAASFLLPLVYGASFADATVQFLIMLPGIFFISVESVLVQHFTGTGLPAAIPAFWLITLIFNLGLNFALIPKWGARAAALNSTLSYALIFVLVTVYFWRKTRRGPLEIFLLRKTEIRNLYSRIRRAAFARP